MANTSDAPGPEVCAAFDVAPGTLLQRLPGGRGLTWAASDVVLRPHGDLPETLWKADVLASLEHSTEFRTSRPIRSERGGWTLDGWEAWLRFPGEADESRVVDVIRAGNAFHRAVGDLGRPDFIGAADDPWSRADRMAWQEEPLPTNPFLDRLGDEFRPVLAPSQVIHGDLLGNVLFTPGEPPTIIDWAPYWRPSGLGAAIAAVDAVCWHDWPREQLGELGAGIEAWPQLLVRALAFRAATWHLLHRWDESMAARHEPAAAAVMALCPAAPAEH